MSPPIVTVFGATGKQGGGVIRSLLDDGSFHVRGVTRRPESPAAKSLKSQGVEVVEADLFNKEQVERAISGSTIVFGVTNFWDPDNFTRHSATDPPEFIQGKNLIEASEKHGVEFFVWSSLPGTTDVSKAAHKANPKVKEYTNIKHYDHKALVDKLLATSGLKYAIVHLGAFFENVYSPYFFTKNADGSYTLCAPNFKADGIAEPLQEWTWVSRDLGPSVLALIKNYKNKGSEILGNTFLVINGRASHQSFARALQDSTGKKITFTAEGKAGQELEDMFEFQATIGVHRDKPVPDPRLVDLGVKFGTMEEFAASEEVKAVFT